MFRPASRALLRAPAVSVARGPTRRFISSSTGPTKSRSWKNTFVRVGLAAGAVYYYNTSSVFAETPSLSFRSKPQPKPEDENHLPTLDSIKPKSREEKKAPALAPSPSVAAEAAAPSADANAQSELPLKSAEELEAEADQQAAFNPETGEINWDCPCLGGMAYGPCGEEFRAAFSCFVYSEEEPKGMDCIDKFKAMQDCFRAHPDVYGAELDDEEEAGAEAGAAGAEPPLAAEVDASVPPAEKNEQAKEVHNQVKSAVGEVTESEEVVPEAWHESEVEKTSEEQTEK
ncbi:hypothetical protein BDW71DRAFT_191165 [Aspergillus fruticulosus]